MTRAASSWGLSHLSGILGSNLRISTISLAIFFAGESDDEDKDPAEPDSDSDSQEELETDQPTLFCTDKQPKSGDIKSRVLAMNGKTQAQALDSSFKKNGATKMSTQSDLSFFAMEHRRQ